LHFEAECYVFDRRSPGKQIEALKHHGAAMTRSLAFGTVDQNRSRIWIDQSVDDAQERRLAATAGPDNSDELEIGDRERQIGQDRDLVLPSLVENFADAANLEFMRG
jgi:hypothetical protein